MRRLAFLLAALAAALALVACGGKSGGRIWLSHNPLRFGGINGCSGNCFEATIRWSLSYSGATGYYVYENGTEVADVNTPGWSFSGLACGQSYTLAVQAHNGSGGTGPLVSTSYSSPACQEFPLVVSSNGRYLKTNSGSPFLMVGDSPQSLIGDDDCGTITNGVCASTSTVAKFLADRVSEGFNTVWINLLCDSYTFCASNGQTYDGVAPFTSGTDAASYLFGSGLCGDCNSTYFTRAHAVVETAEKDGLEVVLDPIETGGWLSMLDNASNGDGTVSTTDGDYRYGEYLGNEFGDLSNIIWMSGNDFNQTSLPSTADDNDALSVANGIAANDPSALQTTELNFFVSKSTDEAAWSTRLNLDGAYTYSPQYAEVAAAYASSPTLPTFLEETNYEAEQNSSTDGCTGSGGEGSIPTAAQAINCRLAEWWTMTSGATGQLYGSYFTDSIGCGCSHSGALGSGPSVPAQGYTSADIDTVAVTQLGYVTSLFEDDLPAWQNLAPDTGHTLLFCTTSGTQCGSCPTSGTITTVTCVTDSADSFTSDTATEAVAYLPDPSSFSSVTINLADFAGGVTAKWYDPTDGVLGSAISGSPFTNSGTHTFTPSTNNNAGDKDWVLVLTAS